MDMTKINEFFEWVLAWGKKIIEMIKQSLSWMKEEATKYSEAEDD
jgi:hypothetical protein